MINVSNLAREELEVLRLEALEKTLLEQEFFLEPGQVPIWAKQVADTRTLLARTKVAVQELREPTIFFQKPSLSDVRPS